MDIRTLNFVARACGGTLLRGSPDTGVRRVCTDSRQVQSGDLFFALAGERFDGHAFAPEAAAKAAAVVIERGRAGMDLGNCATLSVDNTRAALGRFARHYRSDFSLPVIAVCGSNGKTTTKELIAAVLRQKFETLWSESSFNNDVGVPLTLLRLETRHQVAVIEAGTNHPGELEPLLRMAQPGFGVVTSIGREHLEFFGDLAGVVQEEGRLAEVLPSSGKLFLNGDGQWAVPVARRSCARVVRVGLGEGNEWRARQLRLSRQGLAFRVEAPHPEFAGEYQITLLGRHQAINALFAIALGAELGLNRTEIQRGLAECKAPRMRLELWELKGVRVLDDTYNANADSMAAALEVLRDLPCRGRRIAVLGDMAELGAHSEAAHEEVGRRAAELGVAQLFALGKMASFLARGARDAGLNRVLEFGDIEAAASAVKQFIKPGDLLLLKASRSTRLERVADVLRNGEGRN